MNSNVKMGAVVCLVGLAIILATNLAETPGWLFALGLAAVLFGGIQLAIGVTQGRDIGDGADLTDEQVNAAGTAVILRSMISMAAADGRLDEEEIKMVRAVTRSIFGSELDEATMREMSQKMISGHGNIASELASVQHAVTPEDADLAVTGMAMVAMADGDMDALETQRLESYASALGVSQDRFEKALAKAREGVAQLFGAKDGTNGASDET